MAVGKVIKVIKYDQKSGIYKDEFGDSKFGLDMCNYFPREMIQNSLDVRLDCNKPLKVSFTFKDISVEKIPGLIELKDIIIKCMNTPEVQQDTKKQYEKMLERIESGTITCLKVSDRNSKGVLKTKGNVEYTEVENESWKAMVYDEGHTVKSESGSGGRHGVGKKVAFILSSLRTVMYYTHNKGDVEMFMGKSIYTDFKLDGKSYSNKIWFGKLGDSEFDYQPLVKGELIDIDPFFYHTDGFGTDITIIGIDEMASETDIEMIKKKIIYGILDNFFVAILEKRLEVEIQGTTLSNVDNRFIEKIETYREDYESEYTRLTSDDFTKASGQGKSNLQYGNLFNYLKAYTESNRIEIPAEMNGKKVGSAFIYIIPENSFGKKYASIFRKHGMKIMDIGPVSSANTPFSAVICIEGDELNNVLGNAENAAHDDFDTWEDRSPEKKMYQKLMKDIKEKIKEVTKVDVKDEIPIDDFMGATVSFWGDKNQATLVEEKEDVSAKKIDVTRKKRKKSGKGESSKSDSQEEGKKNKKRKRNNGKIINGKNYMLIDEFNQEPIMIYDKKTESYILKFEVKEPLDNVLVDLSAINRDNGEEGIVKNYISSVSEKNIKYKVNTETGTIRKDTLPTNKKTFNICIKLKKQLKYQIKAKIYEKIVKEEPNE